MKRKRNNWTSFVMTLVLLVPLITSGANLNEGINFKENTINIPEHDRNHSQDEAKPEIFGEEVSQNILGEIAFIKNNNIWTINSDGSNLQQMTTRGGYSEPEWSRDGLYLTAIHKFVMQQDQKNAWEIVVINLGTVQEEVIVPAELFEFGIVWPYYRYYNPRWSLDGKSLYYISDDGRASGYLGRKVDIDTGQKDVGFTPIVNARHIDISPSDGKIIFTYYFNGVPNGWSLNLANQNGSFSKVLIPLQDGRDIFYPRFSSNGDEVVYVISNLYQQKQSIEIMKIDGSILYSFPVEYPTAHKNFSWSPDKTRIIFEKNNNLYILILSSGAIVEFIEGVEPSWRWASIGDIDLIIEDVIPMQVLEDQPLILGKSTAVKVVIQKTGSGIAHDVSVCLEIGSKVLNRLYVDENNRDQYNALKSDDLQLPLNFGSGDQRKHIYFFSNDLTPTANTLTVTAKVDCSGSYDQKTKSVDVVETRWAYFDAIYPSFSIRYYMADWYNRSSFNSFYRYTNNFLEGVLPVANNMYEPSKSSYTPSSTKPFRGDDEIFNKDELIKWSIAVASSLRLINPSIDKFVVAVPPGWFSNYTTYKTNLGFSHPLLESLIVTEARTFSKPNGLSIAAHELGHTFELWSSGDCEEYQSACNSELKDNIGNYSAEGIFVKERIPIEITDERKVYCFMGSVNPNNMGGVEYWIDSIDYGKILDVGKQNSKNLVDQSSSNHAILVSGSIGIDDNVTLSNWYILQDAELSHISPGTYYFEYLDENKNLLHSISFEPEFAVMGIDFNSSPFVFTIPYIDGTDKITITHNGSKLAEKLISPNPPIVELESPNGGEVISEKTMITWTGSDADLDELSYSVLVSSDNGVTWDIIVFDIQETEFNWDAYGLLPSSRYLIKVIATDGINTGQDSSDGLFSVLGRIFLPLARK